MNEKVIEQLEKECPPIPVDEEDLNISASQIIFRGNGKSKMRLFMLLKWQIYKWVIDDIKSSNRKISMREAYDKINEMVELARSVVYPGREGGC